ncbi:MAG: transporter substrate-binding domain-containing protein [Desulforhopalus sp.]|nr:transporter substrate-binding domain-containing protein [Desulforhopalus sp.]
MFSIRTAVLSLFVIVSCLIAGLSLGMHFYFNRQLAQTSAEKAFTATAEKIHERIQALDRNSRNLLNQLGRIEAISPLTDEKDVHLTTTLLLTSLMEQNDKLYAVYIARPDGNFFEVINLEKGKKVQKDIGATPQDRWITFQIEDQEGVRIKTTRFLDKNLAMRVSTREPSTYNPKDRPWYKKALKTSDVVKTPPYLFASSNLTGVSYAKKFDTTGVVISIDICITELNASLRAISLPPHSKAFVFNDAGDIIVQGSVEEPAVPGQSVPSVLLTHGERAFVQSHPVIQASNEMDWPPFDFAISGEPKGYSVDLLNLLAEKTGLTVKYVNGLSWNQLKRLYKQGNLDLLHSVPQSREWKALGLLSHPYGSLPQAVATLAGVSPVARLKDLAGRTVAVPRGWTNETSLKDNYPEIRLLRVDTPIEAIRAVTEGKADAVLDSRPVLQYLIAQYFPDEVTLGPVLPPWQDSNAGDLRFLVQKNLSPLQSILNKALDAMTPAEWAQLDREWFPGGSKNTVPVTSQALFQTLKQGELRKLAASKDQLNAIQRTDIEGEPYFAYVRPLKKMAEGNYYVGFLAPAAETIAPYMQNVYISILVTLGLLLLLIPLVFKMAGLIINPINALGDESEKIKQRRYDEVSEVSSNITEIVNLSSSLISAASSHMKYAKAQHNLLESFIKLLATAIDKKSPYTGEHCKRVPALSAMIARVASDTHIGPLAEFALIGDDQWREFRIASWLHDCGKIITPEFIVDKGTKLEVIHNRIHEIRTRFEVLLRDAEIDYWKALAHGTSDQGTCLQTLQTTQKQLRDDFVFVAQCNIGSEFMGPENVARIKVVARRTWTRTLSDRLGLSHIELQRYPSPAPQLPCREPLLADRAEHIIERSLSEKTNAQISGFTMHMPEQLYNQGEIYNLCIPHGTLTPEDRYKINEHVISTIRMLEPLPFPENMARIPEYAGAHHENIIGTGYPRGLKGNQIPIPARILALADVFEALTASDRPYRKAKKLSEAVQILSVMARASHIDPDLFRLFLSSGLYLQYAEKFLDPAQIDDVDVEYYLHRIS